ncbi:TAP-like protein-domain-containing protein [Dactylonectria macrodidyma]|uniref:TAP-like protein-domain-containing protein n=1 Tax=Dactylonectria macrodidyma TaxID=307937 RepID=A0A9P9JDR3_9HYPO|nr:TAP-like protein-domain-containing protein [Dactylonectria macrodidyma]
MNGTAKGFSTKLKTDNTEPNGGSEYATRAIYCQDYGSSFSSVVDVKSVLGVTSALLPLTRGALEAFAVAAYCVGWPAPERNPAHTLDPEQAKRLPPILLVNVFCDPETSSAWAQGVREQIPSAVNIWRNGSGHTSYPLEGETRNSIEKFLISGKLPAQGAVFGT